ncbi:PhnA domain-containing protein, partial [Acinetobacter sp. 105-3]|uniref:PhnA domain-containing protein n=1 Tax=Acinetobacter sp. 105-3 TaxID=2686015 RepID=UPI00195A8E98
LKIISLKNPLQIGLCNKASSVVKVGTKVKTIRLVPDASDGHNIDCKIDGIGQMKLKSEFVKKA